MNRRLTNFIRCSLVALLFITAVKISLAVDQLTPNMNYVNQLAPNMNDYDKRKVIDSLSRVPADRLNDTFVNHVKHLTSGMRDDRDKKEVIVAVSQVPANRLNDTFVNHVNQLVSGRDAIDGDVKGGVIEALSQVPADRLNDTFINYVNQLTPRYVKREVYGDWGDVHVKRDVIKALSPVPADRLNDTFVKYANQLIRDEADHDKAIIIRALSHVPADRFHDTFVNYVSQLNIKGGFAKFNVIGHLSQVPANRLNDTFVNYANQLIRGVKDTEKASVIVALCQIPAQEFAGRLARVHNLELYNPEKDKTMRLYAILETPLNQNVPPRG